MPHPHPHHHHRRHHGPLVYGDRYGLPYVVVQQSFPPEMYCHCNNNRPGCIPGAAPCDFPYGLGQTTMPESTKMALWVGLGLFLAVGAYVMSPEQRPESSVAPRSE